MTNPNDTAFATPSEHGCNGLTKREYFAVHIAAGINAWPTPADDDPMSPQDVALTAVSGADALIAELNKVKS